VNSKGIDGESKRLGEGPGGCGIPITISYFHYSCLGVMRMRFPYLSEISIGP
jgi:hypothetical protein